MIEYDSFSEENSVNFTSSFIKNSFALTKINLLKKLNTGIKSKNGVKNERAHTDDITGARIMFTNGDNVIICIFDRAKTGKEKVTANTDIQNAVNSLVSLCFWENSKAFITPIYALYDKSNDTFTALYGFTISDIKTITASTV